MTPVNTSPDINPRHETFIQQMILHGNKLRAYKAAYPKATDEAARTASTRLLKDPYIKEKLHNAINAIHIGVVNDKMAFIHQELKIISQKRKLLLEIYTGARNATINEQLKAVRLDTELAEQQAKLSGYGSMRSAKNVLAKNTETVTKMNNEQIAEPIEPATGNDLNGDEYPAALCVVVTNETNYTCNPQQYIHPEPDDPIARYKIAVEKSDRYWAERRQQEVIDAIKGKWE